MNFTYNYQIIDKYYQFFMYNKWSISNDIKQWIELLHHASIDVSTICAILKEFGDYIIWVYNNIYNFIY